MDFKKAEETLDLMPMNEGSIVPSSQKEDNDLKYLLDVGLEAVSELVEIARNSENTKAYDSLSKMLKVVSDIKFKMKENTVNNNKVINNSVFISTTKNIIDSISKEIDKIYDLTKEEVELIEKANLEEMEEDDEDY